MHITTNLTHSGLANAYRDVELTKKVTDIHTRLRRFDSKTENMWVELPKTIDTVEINKIKNRNVGARKL